MKRLMMVAAIMGAVGLAGSAWAAGDAAAGKAAADPCGKCHGDNGEGIPDKGKKIAGEDPAKFIAQMNDYKAGKGESKPMIRISGRLSDQDIADLAAYYATLK